LWNTLVAATLRAVDVMIADGGISMATRNVLSAELDNRQILDLIFTAGSYDILAWMFKSLDLTITMNPRADEQIRPTLLKLFTHCNARDDTNH